MAVSEQIPSTTPKVQVPMPWLNQMPQYMYKFQNPNQQLPPYQGYPFPSMQPIPHHYPRSMQWPPSMKEYSPARKKFLDKKGLEHSREDRQTESSDSEVGSDSDSYIQQDKRHSSTDAPYRKKHRKKSSKTVVIRNINYITPKRRNGEKVEVSDESSSDEDEFIDEDSLKQKVDDAVGSLEKLRKSNSSNHWKKGSHKTNHIANGVNNAPAQDFDNNLVSTASQGGTTNENWDVFQNLLMRDEEANEHFIVRSSGDGSPLATNSAIDLELEKIPRQQMAAGDSCVVTQRGEGHEDRVTLEDFENAENFRSIMKRMDSTEEDLVISRRLGESGSGLGGILSSCATESSIIKPGKGEDWFVINHSEKPENQDAANEQTTFNGNCMLSFGGACSNDMKSRKDILIDDSFMVNAQPSADDSYDSHWKTAISMDADLTLSSQLENGTAQGNLQILDFKEPNDLSVVLERDSGFESARESWTTDHGIDISFMEPDRRLSVGTCDVADNKLLSNCDSTTVKNFATNGRKLPVKEVRSKPLPGSLGKSKTEIMSRSKKSSLTSRPTVQKSKLEKVFDEY